MNHVTDIQSLAFLVFTVAFGGWIVVLTIKGGKNYRKYPYFFSIHAHATKPNFSKLKYVHFILADKDKVFLARIFFWFIIK